MSNDPEKEPARFYTATVHGERTVVLDRDQDNRQCGYEFDDEEEAVRYATYLNRMHRKGA